MSPKSVTRTSTVFSLYLLWGVSDHSSSSLGDSAGHWPNPCCCLEDFSCDQQQLFPSESQQHQEKGKEEEQVLTATKRQRLKRRSLRALLGGVGHCPDVAAPLPWDTQGMLPRPRLRKVSPFLCGLFPPLCPLSNFPHTVIPCCLIEHAGLTQWSRQVVDRKKPSQLRKELPGARVLAKRLCFLQPKLLASL